jgi:hypothetical protein
MTKIHIWIRSLNPAYQSLYKCFWEAEDIWTSFLATSVLKPSKSTREGICKGVLARDFVGKAGVHFPCSKTLRIYLALRISISAAIFHSTLWNEVRAAQFAVAQLCLVSQQGKVPFSAFTIVQTSICQHLSTLKIVRQSLQVPIYKMYAHWFSWPFLQLLSQSLKALQLNQASYTSLVWQRKEVPWSQMSTKCVSAQKWRWPWWKLDSERSLAIIYVWSLYGY